MRGLEVCTVSREISCKWRNYCRVETSLSRQQVPTQFPRLYRVRCKATRSLPNPENRHETITTLSHCDEPIHSPWRLIYHLLSAELPPANQMANSSLITVLPLELILTIASYLESGKDLSALSRASKTLYFALLEYRYRKDVAHRPFSVLIWAIRQRNHKVTRHAIDAGAKATCSQSCCVVTSPLELAAQCNYDDMVALLLGAQGINVNARSTRGLTALCWAVANHNRNLVRLLLDAEGVDIEARDSCGRTPLAIALDNGDAALIQELLDHGANVNLCVRSESFMAAQRAGFCVIR